MLKSPSVTRCARATSPASQGRMKPRPDATQSSPVYGGGGAEGDGGGLLPNLSVSSFPKSLNPIPAFAGMSALL
jgi:hypothetical protein